MPVITLDEWKDAVSVISVFKQSAALQEVTRAFTLFEQRKTQSNLEALAAALATWRTTGPIFERTTLVAAGNNLVVTIGHAKNTNEVINAKASNVGQSTLYDFVTPLRADMPGLFTLLPAHECLPPLKPGEIAKINEAFRRARKAAELARDAAKKIAALPAWPGVPMQEQANHVDFFGIFDRARAAAVFDNYCDIVDAFDNRVMLYDIRNTAFGRDCYAACEKGRITRSSARTARRVTSRVTMVMGRDFFTGSIPKKTAAGGFSPSGAYEATSDATAGTIVHEMAHGSFSAVDAPKVDASGNWELQPDLTAGDSYGASPDNDQQSSTVELDKRLAAKDPSIAIRNADNYGQFARLCLQAAGET